MKKLILLPLLLSALVGCQKDTNEITPEAIKKADADRIKAIDNDPTITDKEKYKEMLGLVPGKGRAAGQPPSGTPTSGPTKGR